jgi:hypothetical protein
MASNKQDLMQLLYGAMIKEETTFYATYGYTNAIVIRSAHSSIGTAIGADEIHIILAGSKYFTGDSTFRSAPTGSIGINKAGGSSYLMYLKNSTGASWGAVSTAAKG